VNMFRLGVMLMATGPLWYVPALLRLMPLLYSLILAAAQCGVGVIMISVAPLPNFREESD